ncbi:S24 family peptidase [Chloroflexota bacterium]
MSNINLDKSDFVEIAANILGEGNTLRFRARGSSMRPFIRDGDILEVKPLNGVKLRRTDIILGKSTSGHIVAHRVIKIEQNEGGKVLLIQGDALYNPDGYVKQSEVLGVVVGTERDRGYQRMDTITKRILAYVWISSIPIIRIFRRCFINIKHLLLGMSKI